METVVLRSQGLDQFNQSVGRTLREVSNLVVDRSCDRSRKGSVLGIQRVSRTHTQMARTRTLCRRPSQGYGKVDEKRPA